MASVVYPKYKEALLTGSSNISLTTGDVKVSLVDTGVYTYSAAHDFYDDVSAGVISTTSALGSKTVTSGVFDAADTSWSTVTGASCEALIVWIDTATPSTSRVVAYIDSGTGLPVTPNGNNINLTFDNGANKIFAL